MDDEIKLTVRLPRAVHKGLVELASTENRSMNQQIVHSVSRSIKGNGIANRLAEVEGVLRNLVGIIDSRLNRTLENLTLEIDSGESTIEEVEDV